MTLINVFVKTVYFLLIRELFQST